MAWLERRARRGFVIMEFWDLGKRSGDRKEKVQKGGRRSEAAAVEKAAALGCVDPQSVEVIPFLPPSEKQQRYAADLGVRLPEGCTVVDATALISRAEIGDDQDPAPGLVEYAQSCGVCFLRWPERVACLTVWFASFRSGRRRSFRPCSCCQCGQFRSGGSSKSSAVFEVCQLPIRWRRIPLLRSR